MGVGDVGEDCAESECVGGDGGGMKRKAGGRVICARGVAARTGVCGREDAGDSRYAGGRRWEGCMSLMCGECAFAYAVRERCWL